MKEQLEAIKLYFEENHSGKIIYPEYIEFHVYVMVCKMIAELK